jgi:hypothetical protein
MNKEKPTKTLHLKQLNEAQIDIKIHLKAKPKNFAFFFLREIPHLPLSMLSF